MIGKGTISVIVSLVFACALVSGEMINALKLAKRCEATGPDGTDWANEFDKPVDFLCESNCHRYISYVRKRSNECPVRFIKI